MVGLTECNIIISQQALDLSPGWILIFLSELVYVRFLRESGMAQQEAK
jgi:hypothetical protein